MKYAIITIITLLFISLTFNYVQKNGNDKLKAQISSFKEKTDTVIIKGVPDTVKVQRITKIYVEVPKDKTIDLDTVINDHVISIKTDQSKLFVNVECKRADLIVRQTDTLRIPVMVEVQLPPKPIPFLERKELWFVSGVAITYAILKAVSKN